MRREKAGEFWVGPPGKFREETADIIRSASGVSYDAHR